MAVASYKGLHKDTPDFSARLGLATRVDLRRAGQDLDRKPTLNRLFHVASAVPILGSLHAFQFRGLGERRMIRA